MNSKPARFSLIHTSADITLYCILAIVMTLSFTVNRFLFTTTGARVVNVYVYGVLVETAPLNTPTTITLYKEDYLNPAPVLPNDADKYAFVGDVVVIEINAQSQVRVAQEDSPLKICSLQGWVGTTGLPIVCAPNHLMVLIEAAD